MILRDVLYSILQRERQKIEKEKKAYRVRERYMGVIEWGHLLCTKQLKGGKNGWPFQFILDSHKDDHINYIFCCVLSPINYNPKNPLSPFALHTTLLSMSAMCVIKNTE